MFLRAGLKFAGFEGDARHHVDEGAGYVEDFFDLWGSGVSGSNSRALVRVWKEGGAYEADAMDFHRLF